MKINEKLGVPEGISETASKLHKQFIKDIKLKIKNEIPYTSVYKNDTDIYILILENMI